MENGSCKCNSKGWLFYSLAMAVLYFGMDMFFHGFCLKNLYMENATLFRPQDQMMALQKVGYFGYLLFGMLFTYLYSKGYEMTKSGIGQGFRFGIFIALFYWGVNLLTNYPYAAYPDGLYWGWAAVGIFEFILLGIILGALYKPYK